MVLSGLCETCKNHEWAYGVQVCCAEYELAWVMAPDRQVMHLYDAVKKRYPACEVVDCEDYE